MARRNKHSRRRKAALLAGDQATSPDVPPFQGRVAFPHQRLLSTPPIQLAQQLSATLKRLYTAIFAAYSEKTAEQAARLEAICQELGTLFQVDNVQLWLGADRPKGAPGSPGLVLRSSLQTPTETTDHAVDAPALDLSANPLIAGILMEPQGRLLNQLHQTPAGATLSAALGRAEAALVAPLLADGRVLGLLVLLDRSVPARFTPDDLQLVALFTDHLAVALQQATVVADAQTRAAADRRGRRALARASEAIASTLQLEVVAEQIVAVVRAFLGVQSAWLMVYDEEMAVLRLRAIAGWDAMPLGVELLPGASIAGEVFLSGQPIFVPDVQREPRYAAKREAAEAGIVAMMGLPLLAQGKVVGVLGLNPRPDADGAVHDPLAGPDGDWLRLFAGQAGVAVQNARLYDRLHTEHAFAAQLAQGAQRHAREMETIFESMAEGVAVFDTHGQIVRLNRMGAALAGLTSASVMVMPPTALGTGLSDRLGENSLHLACEPLVTRALAGEVVTGELLLLARPDGTELELQASVAPLSGEDGQVNGAVGILEDVTDQRQHQREQLAFGWVAAALNHPLDLKETLDTAVEALTAALGADHSAILLADGPAGLLRVAAARGYSESCLQQFEVLPIEKPLLAGSAFLTRKVQFAEHRAGSPVDLATDPQPLDRPLAEDGILASLAAPLLVEDQAVGVLVYTYLHPHQFSLAEQQVARAIADQIALAVMNARLYEAVADYGAWQETERRTLQTVIDALPAGVTLRDETGKVFMYNKAALAMARNQFEVLAAREEGQPPIEPIWEVVQADGETAQVEALPSQLAVITGKPVQGRQFAIRQADGRVIPVLVNAAPVQDADGNFTRGVAIFQDITELKELERLKDEFISFASHELRGPLTVIRGQAQFLQKQLRRQEKQGQLPPGWGQMLDSIEGIESQTGRLNDLVNDLLDVSRLQAGRLTLLLGPVDVFQLLTKVVKHWAPASMGHQLVLEVEQLPHGITGQWDARRIEQIVQNLVGNAIKYSPDGGKVTIRGWMDGEQVVLSVQDVGMGIPPEALPHLFERFYRATNANAIGGTGLGLYICHQLAAAHGGSLLAESPGVGHGSLFYLRLPLT